MNQPIAVLGGGHAGIATAADLTLHGYTVNFYEVPEFAARDTSNFKPILETGKIEVIVKDNTRQANIRKVTTDIREALDDVKLILMVMSAEGHEAFFNRMIPRLQDGQVVVIEPGNFGSFRLRKLLKEKTPSRKIVIYEMSQPYYVARVAGPAKINITFSFGPEANPKDYPIRNIWTFATAANPAKDNDVAFKELQVLCPESFLAKNVLVPCFSNPSNFLHPITALMNAGFIEHSVEQFSLWRDGATQSVVRAEQAQSDEIDKVAQAYGVETSRMKNKENVYNAMKEWRGPDGVFRNVYGPGKLRHRYIVEDLGCGLVPIAQLAKKAGVPAPITDGLIAIASAALEEDFLKTGHNMEYLGLEKLSKQEIMKLVG
ncbi:MAG TPA: NAD/NADP octopine/nopaline dehydrogenase family protein [Dehalococcoidia bacterium]|nr:NAD/NADP octopine/nopaline dehydrogenase family protein [Dehalococcoidia bacterium]